MLNLSDISFLILKHQQQNQDVQDAPRQYLSQVKRLFHFPALYILNNQFKEILVNGIIKFSSSAARIKTTGVYFYHLRVANALTPQPPDTLGCRVTYWLIMHRKFSG